MTVSELRSILKSLEDIGLGDLPVVSQNDYSNSMLEVGRCGTLECWIDTTRLTHGEYRSESQLTNKGKGIGSTKVVTIQ